MGVGGECPWWYLVLRAAERLHMAPAEVLAGEGFWLMAALKAMEAEGAARQYRDQVERTGR